MLELMSLLVVLIKETAPNGITCTKSHVSYPKLNAYPNCNLASPRNVAFNQAIWNYLELLKGRETKVDCLRQSTLFKSKIQLSLEI